MIYLKEVCSNAMVPVYQEECHLWQKKEKKVAMTKRKAIPENRTRKNTQKVECGKQQLTYQDAETSVNKVNEINKKISCQYKKLRSSILSIIQKNFCMSAVVKIPTLVTHFSHQVKERSRK